MLRHEPALCLKEERGAVEGATVSLDDSNDDIDSEFGCELSEDVGLLSWHVHRRIRIATELLPSGWGACPHGDLEVEPLRVSAEERFWQHDETRTLGGGFPNVPLGFAHGGGRVKEGGSQLGRRRQSRYSCVNGRRVTGRESNAAEKSLA